MEEFHFPNTTLELWTIWLFAALDHPLEDYPFWIQSDNATVAHISYLEAGKSLATARVVNQILFWVKLHTPAFLAMYISCVGNWQVDLSENKLDSFVSRCRNPLAEAVDILVASVHSYVCFSTHK